MAEKLLTTEALDLRDFLKKKIRKDIDNFRCTEVISKNKDSIKNESVEDYTNRVKSEYQSIKDQIDRYDRLCKAIILANATTEITVNDVTMTRAEAISIRKSITDSTTDYLKLNLLDHLKSERMVIDKRFIMATQNWEEKTDKYKSNLIGRESKELTDKEIESIKNLTADLEPKIVDPIEIGKEIDTLTDSISSLIRAIESAIKVSNATTYVEF